MLRGNSYDLIIFDDIEGYWDEFLLQIALFKETYEENTNNGTVVPISLETLASNRYGVPVFSA